MCRRELGGVAFQGSGRWSEGKGWPGIATHAGATDGSIVNFKEQERIASRTFEIHPLFIPCNSRQAFSAAGRGLRGGSAVDWYGSRTIGLDSIEDARHKEEMRVRIAALLASALAGNLPAQGFSGVIRDSLTQRPLAGAVVILNDASGTALARAVTDRQGVYHLQSDPTGARLRVLRLGFRPREFDLGEWGGRAPATVSLQGIPLLLETVRTVASASCPRRADRPAALALLEQVRSGLLAAIVGRANNTGTMKRIRYERRLDPGGTLIRQNVVLDLASVDRPYSAARGAAGFVRDGFAEDSTNLFFAPEAETLVDPDFAGGYCFHLMPPDPFRVHQVGLGFRPAKRRAGRVDIEGALWVDSTQRKLTDLVFRYVGLAPVLEDFAPGGRLSFTEMPNGVPLISSWSIRLASAHLDAGSTPGSRVVRDRRGRRLRIEVDDTGGQLADAAWPDGTIWQAPLGTLRIRVAAATGEPAAGTAVRLLDSSYEAVTDSAGVAVIERVLPGRYTAAVVDTQLAVLGILLAAPAPVTAVRDSVTTADLVATTAEQYVARSCSDAGVPAGTAFILGRAVLPDGRSATGAEWTIYNAAGEPIADGGKVGDDGLLHWCEAWPGEQVKVTARLGNRSAEASHVLAAGLTILRLVMAP